MTLAGLLTKLGYRLRDSSSTGQWSSTEKYQFLNSGRRRTLVATRSYKTTQSIPLVDGTHTYDVYPIFDPEAIRIGDDAIEKHPLGGMAIIKENWDAVLGSATADPFEGKPTRWVPLGGTRIRINPTPDTGHVGMVGTIAQTPTAGGTGYAVGDVLTIDNSPYEEAQVEVTAVTAGVVTAVALHTAEDTKEVLKAYRGLQYTTGTGKATTAVSPATGTGCTVNIQTLCKLEVYGAATVDDLGTGIILTLASAPTAGGTGYTVNDILVVTTGGSDGKVRVTAVTSGVVTAVELVSAGNGYTTGSGKATNGGTGSGCTVNISAIRDATTTLITDLSDAAEEAVLLAAEEEAWAARANMPAASAREDKCRVKWSVECEGIKKDLGIR